MVTEEKEHKVRIPLFPMYSTVQSVMNTINGVPKQSVTRLIQNIWAQTGTPQKPVDWSEPDKWIPERLTDEDALLARRIWEESRHEVNPRHIYGDGSITRLLKIVQIFPLSPVWRKFDQRCC